MTCISQVYTSENSETRFLLCACSLDYFLLIGQSHVSDQKLFPTFKMYITNKRINYNDYINN